LNETQTLLRELSSSSLQLNTNDTLLLNSTANALQQGLFLLVVAGEFNAGKLMQCNCPLLRL